MSWESPFDSDVGFSHKCEADLDGFALHPDEAALLSERAVEKRRLAFALGRAAAVDALAAIGVPRMPILTGPRGEPLWPDGVVGTISHADGFGVAAAALRKTTAGLGLDIEPLNRRINLDISSRVCGEGELAWVCAPDTEPEQLGRLLRLFSAKEATYKAFYPLQSVFLNFKDVTLIWDEADSGFRGVLHKPVAPGCPAGTTFSADSRTIEGLVLSAVVLPPASA